MTVCLVRGKDLLQIGAEVAVDFPAGKMSAIEEDLRAKNGRALVAGKRLGLHGAVHRRRIEAQLWCRHHPVRRTLGWLAVMLLSTKSGNKQQCNCYPSNRHPSCNKARRVPCGNEVWERTNSKLQMVVSSAATDAING